MCRLALLFLINSCRSVAVPKPWNKMYCKLKLVCIVNVLGEGEYGVHLVHFMVLYKLLFITYVLLC